MKFLKGQAIIYTPLTGKKYPGHIIHRKCDFSNNYIDTGFAQGGFDYLIRIVRDRKDEDVFVNEKDLI
ncbi:hypothetical protein MWU78_01480 [Arenibacter sp. F26102]|uniref:hypothetical protein n=1 Tax=Arenibacter sp. F26102 TaxID=2926416 RepID=UPI001FF45B71|nr:hypothetical protein [Arenibacter sp. F26102]MCK0144316.1 hypothetical protein [Arenibacter sp. F26102]